MKKKKSDISPLSLAVKKTREIYEDTQEQFARKLGIAVMTVSRFENGRMKPSHPGILQALVKVAEQKPELAHERTVFQAALKKAIETRPYLGPTYQTVDFGQPVESLDEWMLTAIAKLIVRHYPVAIERVREAGGPITDVVDSAMERAAESLKEGERLTGEKLENWLALCLDEYLWEYRGRMKTEIENINRSEYEKIRQSLRKETT